MSATRTRKAWCVSVRGYDFESTVYARTASKARYQVYLDVSDCNDDISFADIRVLRSKAQDITLPTIPPIAKTVSKEALNCLLHACGANRFHPGRCGFRKHFFCHDQNKKLNELVEAGLMQRAGTLGEDSYRYFIATSLGQKTACSLSPIYAGEDFAWPELKG